jgi:hypothetical protein
VRVTLWAALNPLICHARAGLNPPAGLNAVPTDLGKPSFFTMGCLSRPSGFSRPRSGHDLLN